MGAPYQMNVKQLLHQINGEELSRKIFRFGTDKCREVFVKQLKPCRRKDEQRKSGEGLNSVKSVL